MGFWGPSQIQEVVRTELTEIAWDNQQAGEPISQYDLIYRDGNFWRMSNAFSPSTVPEGGVGMAQDSPTSGTTLDVWIRALVTNAAWAFTSGAMIWLASGGGLTHVPPTGSGAVVKLLGKALTQTSIEFNPGYRYIVGQ